MTGGVPYRISRRLLVAGDGFGGFFFLGGVAIGMAIPVTVAAGRGDGYGLAGVGEVGWDGFGDVLDRADLDNRGLGLLEDQFFVDGADFGLFLVGLLAAGAVFFRSSQRNVVFEVTDTRSVFGVNLQRMLIGFEIDLLALGVDLVLAVGLVPLRDGRVLVHVFDDFAPADAGVVGAEGDVALLRRIGDDAQLGPAEVVD